MPDEAVKIKVESNLFNDVSKLKTAHSYTVVLPRTMTNDSVFALAYVAGAETGGISTHKYLTASLYMDGVPLFVDGQAVISSVDEKGYNINLYWGLLGIFEEIKKEGLDLCDLPASSRWNEATMSPSSHWIYIPKVDDSFPIYTSGMTQSIYDNELSDEGKAEADKLPWLMPSVSANTILNKITQVYGVSLVKTSSASERIGQLWHPLTSLNVMAKGETLTITIDASTMRGQGGKRYIAIPSGTPPSTNSHICASGFVVLNNTPNFGRTLLARNSAHATSIRIYGTCDKEFIAIVGNSMERQSTYNSSSGLWEMDETIYDVKEQKFIQIAPPSYYEESYGWGSGETPQIDVHATLIFDEIGKIADFGAEGVDPSLKVTWNYERNYPNIEIIKYFGEVLAHTGCCIVGSVTKPDALKICTFDEIYNAEPINLDEIGVEKIRMSIDDISQKNIYKHSVNDDIGNDYVDEGVIYSNDETLALEHTAFESKFKVPINGIVKLWKVEEDSNTQGKMKAQWDANGNYIAGYYDSFDVIVDTGQNFAETISDYYTNYEQIINRPKEIEVIVRLSVLDLLNFDMARPIYIPQLGRKYLIKSLESENEEKYKLTLVQI